jgi:hypothetical protein
MKTALITLFITAATAVSAQESNEVVSPPPPPPSAVSERSVGIHVGANVGLFELDAQFGHFYAFGAGNLGVPMITDGSVGFGVIGAGYTVPLSAPSESMWYLDLLALGTAGRNDERTVAGAGVGFGFRYLHRSGFTFSVKVPVFGATTALSGPGMDGATSLGHFYLANLVSLPLLSVGYRF